MAGSQPFDLKYGSFLQFNLTGKKINNFDIQNKFCTQKIASKQQADSTLLTISTEKGFSKFVCLTLSKVK